MARDEMEPIQLRLMRDTARHMDAKRGVEDVILVAVTHKRD